MLLRPYGESVAREILFTAWTMKLMELRKVCIVYYLWFHRLKNVSFIVFVGYVSSGALLQEPIFHNLEKTEIGCY